LKPNARKASANEGFRGGNVQARLESIELDQIRRGVIKVDA
jgi:4-hydroxyphenylpyruvate dioxygenase